MDHYSRTSRSSSSFFHSLLVCSVMGGGWWCWKKRKMKWTEGASPSIFFYSSMSTCRYIAAASACVWEMRRRRFSDIDFEAAMGCSLFSTTATTALYLLLTITAAETIAEERVCRRRRNIFFACACGSCVYSVPIITHTNAWCVCVYTIRSAHSPHIIHVAGG